QSRVAQPQIEVDVFHLADESGRLFVLLDRTSIVVLGRQGIAQPEVRFSALGISRLQLLESVFGFLRLLRARVQVPELVKITLIVRLLLKNAFQFCFSFRKTGGRRIYPGEMQACGDVVGSLTNGSLDFSDRLIGLLFVQQLAGSLQM